MDFEIEGDDDDYNFDWGNDSKPVAKKNSMFGGGGGYEEESEYNFSYENDRGTKKKYEAFSPQAVHSNAPAIKQNVVVANSGNALERAQNLMDKYSGKTVSAPSSNFRNQQIRTFSEADISLSEDEPSESEFEMSESIDDTPIGKKAGAKGGAKGKPVGKRDINALDSKAHVVVSMGELGDSHSDDSDYLSEHEASTTGVQPPPRSLQRAPTFDDVSHGDDEDEGEEPDENEYSNEDFDHDAGESYEESAEEIGESTQMSATVDTEVEVPNSYSHASKAPLGVQFAVRNGTSANFPSTTTNLASGTNENNSGNSTNGGAIDNIKSTTTAAASAPGASSFYTTSNTQSVFNSVRNRPPSPYSDHSDSTRPVSPDPEEESADMVDRDHSIRSESPNENNASYSRLVYGNEDEQDSVSEYSGEESNNNINLNGTGGSRGSHGKPKVFSFADLLSQESWDADKHKDVLPSTTATATAKVSAVTATTNATTANTIANAVVNPLEVSELQDEFTHAISRPVAYVVPSTTTTASATAAMIGNKNAAATTMSVKPVILSEPTRSSSPPTTTSAKSNTFNTAAVIQPTVVPSASQAAALQPTPATAQPPMQHPPYPYTYPPQQPQSTSQAQAATVDAQGQPLPPAGSASFPPPYPTQYPTQYPPPYPYPYPYPPPPMASQMPPQYYPYPYPPSPYYPPPYAPYPAAPTPGMSGMPGHSPPYVSAHPAGHAPHSAHTASYPPSYSYPDMRFSHDGPFNPLLHATTPTLQALESLTNPRGQSVSNRLSLSQSNQLYGSAYFDRDVAQQPLVVDLLQELRKSKEEAQWAKAKLAETIVRLGQQQLNITNINTNNMVNTNNKSGSGGNSNVESGSAESKMSTPDKPRKHNAVSFLQDVISPVLPVRASLNAANSTNNMGGTKGNIANSRRNNLDDSELDEVPSEDESEEEEDEDDAASDYSDDFEDAASSPAPKNKGNSNSNGSGNSNSTSSYANTGNINSNINSGGYSKPTTTTIPSHTTTHNNTTINTTTTATAPVYTGATLAEVKAAQEEASRGIRERERVLNPLKESLAYSLLASQELFKNQLESLRLRIGATNDYTNLLQQRVNSQWDELNTGTTDLPPSSSPLASTTTAAAGSAFNTADLAGTSFQPTPSLHHLRSSFEARRVASSEKLLDLLTQVYPNMTVEEATRLTAKI